LKSQQEKYRGKPEFTQMKGCKSAFNLLKHIAYFTKDK